MTTATARIDASPTVTTMRFTVRCTGTKRDGRTCNKLIYRTNLEAWEREMLAGKIEIMCPRCGTIAVFC